MRRYYNGNAIKRYRKERGYTQESLAEKSGLSCIQISRLEREQSTDPNLTTICKLADALQIRVDQLLSEEEEDE